MSDYYYTKGKLVNKYGQSVMMDWERPVMEKVANILTTENNEILNIGFGMGIVDTFIQTHKPSRHTIIENHPTVQKKMLDDGWDKLESVELIFDKWQNVFDSIGTFDGIYLDTWNDLRIPHINTLLEKCLKIGGKFSIWYNEGEFNTILSKLPSNYEVKYEYIENNSLIPPAEEQYENGGFYIDPNEKFITIPIITKLF
jgi:hypothetical protein